MFKIFIDFIKVFDKKLYNDFIIIIAGSIISGILELFGIMLILPFIEIALSPNNIDKSRFLLYLHDMINVTNNSHMVYIVGALCGLSFILKDIFMLGFQYYQFHLVTKWRNSLSEKMMKLYLGLNYRSHLKVASTAIINTLTSTVSIAVNSFLLQILFIISYSVVSVCLLGYMLINFFEATIITTITLIILTSLQVVMLKKANDSISRNSVSLKEKNMGNMRQGIEAIKETKIFLRESYFLGLFKTSNRLVTDNERKINIIQYIPLYLTEIVMILCIIVLVCGTIYFSPEGSSAFSGVAILVAIAFRLTPVINRILTSYSQIRSAVGAVDYILSEINIIEKNQDLFDIERCEISDLSFETSISLKNVYFSYNDVDQLININLDVLKGEFIGIVGHSGSGKTTIVDILMGLLKPKQGNLLVDNVVADEQIIRALRNKIGYVPQNPFIGNMSIMQNIAYGHNHESIDIDRVKEVLNLVGLLSFFNSKIDGLDFNLGEGGKNLSGGQKQRVAIARALYNRPEIIVLDEATSALDVKSENEIATAIANLKGKVTIIAIAHRLSTIRKADRIVLVNWGEIEDIGTFEDLINRNDYFNQLVELSKL